MPASDGSAAEQPEAPPKQYNVTSLHGLYYIPDYLTPCQQDSLLESIRSSKSRWTEVINLLSRPGFLYFTSTVGFVLQQPQSAGLRPKAAELWRDSA